MSDDPMLRSGFAPEQTTRTAAHYIRNRFKRRQRARRVTEPVPAVPTVARIADPDNLIRIFFEMKGKAGQAPGPDGVGYAGLGGRAVADIMRDLGRAVREGRYRPGPTRPVRVAKLRGGHRTLAVGNLVDRVLAAALNRAMEPLWESIFLPCSMGFRPGRGVWQLLAELQRVMVAEGRWVLALDDVKNAFPSVVIADVLADHARYVTDKSLLSLIEVVLRGRDEKRTKGIDQGSPYSPTALNVRLHHALDLGVMQGHHPSWYRRYADNLLWACLDVSEGHQALNHARQLLEPTGFTLKGEDGITDLRQGQKAQLLGFTLSRRDGHFQLELGKDAWVKLEQNLVKAHETQDPAATARTVVRGWVEAFGPAFEDWRVVTLDRVLQTAARTGFRELDSRAHLADRCETAWRRWDTFRRGVEQSANQDVQQAGIR
jgi:hypothetical protein